MVASTALNASYSVSGSLTEADFQAVARAGFATVINFRPDNETPGQLESQDAAKAARAAGLSYFHIPVAKFNVFADAVVSDTARVFEEAHGPVLGYCASGQRAAIVWAAARARITPVDDVLAALKAAGFELSFLRDDLEAQAGRVHWDVEHAAATVSAQKAELAAA